MTNPGLSGGRAMLELAERRIVAAGEKLAAQIGGTFTIDRRKLRDFRLRARAADTPSVKP